MGQQPNIELKISDLPRPVAHPAPARRWRPLRPGDLLGPDDVPTGTGFGSAGPDAGYASRLAETLSLTLAAGEPRHNAVAAVSAIGAARAAHFGRAPVIDDVELAAQLLGYLPSGVDADLLAELAARRPELIARVGHMVREALALVERVPVDVLAGSPSAARTRMAVGERLFTW
jgi:hypothetical protein